MTKTAIALARNVHSRILLLRGHKIIIDSDLAALYGVTAKRLNEQVKRNRSRFPSDFLFRLLPAEHNLLRSHFATSNHGRGGRRYLPYAFTEHGAIMAATVLNSKRAIQMSLFVVRAFVQLREGMLAQREVAAKLTELERRLDGHNADIQAIIGTLRQLTAPPVPGRRKIGFELPGRSGRADGKISALTARSRALSVGA